MMTPLKDFKYQNLTPRQLAGLVYELNARLVEAMEIGNFKYPRFLEVSEKAQKIINRARLEGIL